jgi:hypothetical protein
MRSFSSLIFYRSALKRSRSSLALCFSGSKALGALATLAIVVFFAAWDFLATFFITLIDLFGSGV